MLHVALAVSQFLGHDIWHWKSGNGYQFWSGIEAAVERPLGWAAFGGIYLRHHNCAAPRCLRLGKHPTADAQHKLCRRHHPDLPNRRLSLREIHMRHHQAKRADG